MSKTFSRSLYVYVLSEEIDIDKKMVKTSIKSCLFNPSFTKGGALAPTQKLYF